MGVFVLSLHHLLLRFSACCCVGVLVLNLCGRIYARLLISVKQSVSTCLPTLHLGLHYIAPGTRPKKIQKGRGRPLFFSCLRMISVLFHTHSHSHTLTHIHTHTQ